MPTPRRYSPPKTPRLPSENRRPVRLTTTEGDALLVIVALRLAADRAEGSAARLRGLAPELHRRAARLRAVAAGFEDQAGNG